MADNDVDPTVDVRPGDPVIVPEGTQEIDINIMGAGNPANGQVVDPQITDAIAQVNVKNLGDASALAVSNLYQTMAHSGGIMFENQVNAQHQLNLTAQAATVTGVSEFYTVDIAEQAVAASKINRSDLAEYLGSLIVALNAASGGATKLVVNVEEPNS